MNILTRFMAKGTIHKRRTHTMGGGGLAKSVRFVDKWEGSNCVLTHFSSRFFTKRCASISEHNKTHKN